MAELSERFAALMARLAQSDAELFRTLGEQNASVRQLLEEGAPSSAAHGLVGVQGTAAPATAALGDLRRGFSGVDPISHGAVAQGSVPRDSESQGVASPSTSTALAPAALLPAAECELKALKRRFGRLDQAQAWLEERLGQAPKKPTWAEVEQTCRGGAWPVRLGRSRAASASRGLSAEDLEQRLLALERRLLQELSQRLEPRLLRLEELLTRLCGAVDQPEPVEPLSHGRQPGGSL